MDLLINHAFERLVVAIPAIIATRFFKSATNTDKLTCIFVVIVNDFYVVAVFQFAFNIFSANIIGSARSFFNAFVALVIDVYFHLQIFVIRCEDVKIIGG